MENQYLLIISYEDKPAEVFSLPLDSHTFPTYTWDMQSVVETDHFLRDAKSIGITDDERDEIVNFMAANPGEGDEIRGTGGARKVRFAGKGKGKLGGYRVFSFYSGKDIPVFLLRIISKNAKSNLTPLERNELKTTLSAIAETYQERKQS